MNGKVIAMALVLSGVAELLALCSIAFDHEWMPPCNKARFDADSELA